MPRRNTLIDTVEGSSFDYDYAVVSVDPDTNDAASDVSDLSDLSDLSGGTLAAGSTPESPNVKRTPDHQDERERPSKTAKISGRNVVALANREPSLQGAANISPRPPETRLKQSPTRDDPMADFVDRSFAESTLVDVDSHRIKVEKEVRSAEGLARANHQQALGVKQIIADLVDSLVQHCHALEDRAVKDRAKLEKMTDMYEENVKALKVFKSSIARSQSRSDKVEKHLNIVTAEKVELESKLAESLEEIAVLDGQIGTLVRDCDAALEAQAQATLERDAARAEISRLQAEVDRLRAGSTKLVAASAQEH